MKWPVVILSSTSRTYRRTFLGFQVTFVVDGALHRLPVSSLLFETVVSRFRWGSIPLLFPSEEHGHLWGLWCFTSVLSLPFNNSFLSFSLWLDFRICRMFAEVSTEGLCEGFFHGTITAAAITAAFWRIPGTTVWSIMAVKWQHK